MCCLFFVPSAHAEPDALSAFIARYPTAFTLFTCGTCHLDFDGPIDDAPVAAATAAGGVGDATNAYGHAFGESNGLTNPDAALLAIEGNDSDGDGTSNGIEILTMTGFHPGYRCDTYANAVNPPADLAFCVDPGEPGCGLLTTTTTSSPDTTTSTINSTTTTYVTTTTFAVLDGCA